MSNNRGADKVHLTELAPVSSKRRRTEELSLSQLQIEDFSISKSDYPSTIHELPYDCDGPQANADHGMALHILNLSPVDRYIHSLLHNGKLWKLTNTRIIAMCDYVDDEEKRTLCPSTIVIIDSLLCTACRDKQCLHAKAAQLAIDDHLFQEVDAKNHAGFDIHFLTENSAILADASTFHLFNCKEGNWFCRTCIKPCNLKSSFLEMLPLSIPNCGDYSEHKYESISRTPIPIRLDDNLSSVYDNQLKYGLQLPYDIKPEKMNCVNGYPFRDLKPARSAKGIIIYTDSDVISLAGHQVFNGTCTGKCRCFAVYDGSSDLLLNIDNHYFVHYSLLYEYSELMTMSRNTLQGFVRAKNRKLVRLGRPEKIRYHIFHHAWNTYLRLVNINYTESFTCSICKSRPDVVIFDGITLGTVKKLPPPTLKFDENQHIPSVPQSTRIFILSKAVRREISQYLQNGLPTCAFKRLLQSIDPKALADYIQSCSIQENDVVTSCNDRAGEVIQYFSRNEPISGVFQFSILEQSELVVIVKLSKGKFVQENMLVPIFRKMYTLERLLLSLDPKKKTDAEGNVSLALNSIICPLLVWIMERLEILYSMESRRLIPFESVVSDYFSFYFPAFKTNYKLPIYEQDDNEVNKEYFCRKNFPSHQTLSPGMIMMTCQHQICYGFQILRQKESTVGILNLLLTQFDVPPRIIIYDNACNLQKTCMIRDPKAFQQTAFLVDRFHSRNHKCTPFYSMKHISENKLNRINSQICEQLFSIIRRISTQIAYMRLENVFYTTRYFLAIINQMQQ